MTGCAAVMDFWINWINKSIISMATNTFRPGPYNIVCVVRGSRMNGIKRINMTGGTGGRFRDNLAHRITAQGAAAAWTHVTETTSVIMDIGAGNYIGVTCLIMTGRCRTGRGPAKIGRVMTAMFGRCRLGHMTGQAINTGRRGHNRIQICGGIRGAATFIRIEMTGITAIIAHCMFKKDIRPTR